MNTTLTLEFSFMSFTICVFPAFRGLLDVMLSGDTPYNTQLYLLWFGEKMSFGTFSSGVLI